MAFGDQHTYVRASGWNALANTINRVFSDATPNSAPSTNATVQNNYKYGWGNTFKANNVAQGDLIEASVFNTAIDPTSVAGHVTGDIGQEVYFMRRAANERISLTDSSLGQTLQYYTDLISSHKNTLAPYHGSVVTPTGGVVTRTTPWKYYMAASFEVTFDSYDKLRYFFNAGGQLQVSPTATGGSSKGFLDWKYLTDQCGSILIGVDGASCTGSIGMQPSGMNNLYALTQTYQLMLTAKANFTGSYGGYGSGAYSGYSAYSGIQIKVWGRLIGNNALLIKIIFDNRAFRHWIDGNTGFHVTYRKADPETSVQNPDVVFNVAPPNSIVVLNSFDTGADDS